MNGPGERYGVWVQGCKHHCPGCLNPATLPPLPDDYGQFIPPSTKGWVEIKTLLEWISKEHADNPLEGITISGGEPFDQYEALYELLVGAGRLGLGTIVFTGNTREELMDSEETRRFFVPHPVMDVLIDGAYDRTDVIKDQLKGSANQRIILLTDRYRNSELIPPGPLECIIEPDGTVIYSGFSILS